MKYNIDYLNTRIRNKDNFVYDGPKSLYKYRPFDNFTFDMFDNEYVYLCPAEKLDDPSECMTEVKLQDLYDYEKNHLKTKCIEQIFDMKEIIKINYIYPWDRKFEVEIALC